MDKHPSTITTAFIACALSACAMGQSPDEETMSDDNRKPEVKHLTIQASPTAVGEAGPGKKRSAPVGAGLQLLVDKARADLMAKMGLSDDEIEVVEAAYVTWPDSSIGCARPGFQYMQVLTNGSRIVLRAGNKLYHYHSGKNRPPFYCERPTVKNPPPYAAGEA